MKKSKKEIIFFSLILLIIILSALYILLKFPPKIGYAYRIHFLQPNIPKDEIIATISSIDSRFLEGVHTIEIADMPLFYEGEAYDGLYIIGGKIRLNVMDGFKKEVLLHELKHHYCWKKERYLGHEGCFKEPPLIVEEPVKDETVIPLPQEKSPSCFDDLQNQDERGVDCGGPCIPCEKETVEMLAPPSIWVSILIYTLILLSILSVPVILMASYHKNRIHKIYKITR